MGLADALRDTARVRGWDWSACRTRTGSFGWSYPEVLRTYMSPGTRTLDVGTGGGEVFSAVARAGDVALDISLDMLAVARENLPCPLVAGHQPALPFAGWTFDVVASRHVGVRPTEVLRVLRPGGFYLTQAVGGHICQSIFDAFGWGSNGEFWRRRAEEEGDPLAHLDVAAMVDIYTGAGCEILRREEARVDHEFLDEESLAFWLLNAPLPEVVDPERHADILAGLSLKTNWHSELLVVRNTEP